MKSLPDWIDLWVAFYWIQEKFPFSIYDKEGALKNALLSHEIPTRGKAGFSSAYRRIEDKITDDTEISVNTVRIPGTWIPGSISKHGECFEAVQVKRALFEAWITSNAVEYDAAAEADVPALKSDDESRAVDFLAPRLQKNPTIKRDDARKMLGTRFRTLSERGFVDRVWPNARVRAGLNAAAPPGPKPKQNQRP
jgi:hypothetical protein